MSNYRDGHYNEINNLTDRLEATLRELQEKEESLQAAAEIGQQIVNKNDELQKEIEGQKEKIDHWESTAKLARREVQILEATLQNSQHQCSELQGQISEQDKEVGRMRNHISDQSARESMAKKDIRVVDITDDDILEHTLYKKLEGKHRQIGNELTSEKERRKQLTEALGKMQDELQTLREVQSKNEDLTKTMKQKAHQYQSEIMQRAQKEKQMSDELVTLVQEHYDQESLIQEQKGLIEAANSEAVKLTEELHKIKLMGSSGLDTLGVAMSQTSESGQEDAAPSLMDEMGMGSLLDEINAMPEPSPSPQPVYSPQNGPPPLTQSREAKRKDAMNEFIHLTVMAVKIRYSTVEATTDAMHKLLAEKKLPFHQIHEYLCRHMEMLKEEQRLRQEVRRKSQGSAQSSQANTANETPTKPGLGHRLSRFASGIFGSKKSSKERNLALQVRFGKRAFQVNMAPDDLFKRMLKAFPPMVGQDPDQVVFVSGDQILDPGLTVEESGVTTDHIIRMLPINQLRDYMDKVGRKESVELKDA